MVNKRYFDFPDCAFTVVGTGYQGDISVTRTNVPCQRWDSQSPHSHPRFGNDRFPDGSVAQAANHCRNPDRRSRPWCYTSDPNIEWEYCDIPACGVYSICSLLTTTILVHTSLSLS